MSLIGFGATVSINGNAFPIGSLKMGKMEALPLGGGNFKVTLKMTWNGIRKPFYLFPLGKQSYTVS